MFDTDNNNNISLDIYRFMRDLKKLCIKKHDKIIKHIIHIYRHDYTTAGVIFSRPYTYSN